MKEWNNPYNSFNSMKGLLYSPWYKSIRDWKDGKINKPLPPIEASLDPIHTCNLMCKHCNAHSYLEEKGMLKRRMSDNHLFNLIRFLGDWGVKAICFGGGGEPTMHTALGKAIELTHYCGMESSVATNGTLLTDKLIETMAKYCRWVGISVDAFSAKTYKEGRNKDLIGVAFHNIKKLSNKTKELESKCDVSFKFLIMPYNQLEIIGACLFAKDLGVKDFHARPADFRHQGLGEWKKKNNEYKIKIIKDQFEKCHEIETKDFRVFTIMHKFDENFLPIKNFTQCYASPCCIQLCANGDIYLCPDQRDEEFYKLAEHDPDPKRILDIWGGKRHYDLVFNIGKDNCATRCTFSPYCKQCEELFIKDTDPMCINFI